MTGPIVMVDSLGWSKFSDTEVRRLKNKIIDALDNGLTASLSLSSIWEQIDIKKVLYFRSKLVF